MLWGISAFCVSTNPPLRFSPKRLRCVRSHSFFSGRISKLEDLLVVGSLVEEGQRASSESQLPIQAEEEVVETT